MSIQAFLIRKFCCLNWFSKKCCPSKKKVQAFGSGMVLSRSDQNLQFLIYNFFRRSLISKFQYVYFQVQNSVSIVDSDNPESLSGYTILNIFFVVENSISSIIVAVKRWLYRVSFNAENIWNSSLSLVSICFNNKVCLERVNNVVYNILKFIQIAFHRKLPRIR